MKAKRTDRARVEVRIPRRGVGPMIPPNVTFVAFKKKNLFPPLFNFFFHFFFSIFFSFSFFSSRVALQPCASPNPCSSHTHRPSCQLRWRCLQPAASPEPGLLQSASFFPERGVRPSPLFLFFRLPGSPWNSFVHLISQAIVQPVFNLCLVPF